VNWIDGPALTGKRVQDTQANTARTRHRARFRGQRAIRFPVDMVRPGPIFSDVRREVSVIDARQLGRAASLHLA
jgi:hypothetical protein